MTKDYKPGEKAPRSGQYEIVGPRGGKTGVERTVTKGEPLPPTERSGQKYILTDPTKHGGKSGK
ncbi:YjzC family protein [Palleronia sp. KMU-117]|uniref:YjzC family protein n=1 Tax=Palleronia sp. KMU-117 TaxID=3434108 RepID=UPI003D74EA9F